MYSGRTQVKFSCIQWTKWIIIFNYNGQVWGRDGRSSGSGGYVHRTCSNNAFSPAQHVKAMLSASGKEHHLCTDVPENSSNMVHSGSLYSAILRCSSHGSSTNRLVSLLARFFCSFLYSDQRLSAANCTGFGTLDWDHGGSFCHGISLVSRWHCESYLSVWVCIFVCTFFMGVSCQSHYLSPGFTWKGIFFP